MVSYGDWLMMRGGGVEFKASTLTIVLARGSQQSMSAKKKKNTQVPSNDGQLLICDNRAARYNYALGETFEAGVQLTGTEVKSCREGRVQIAEAYVSIVSGEVFLLNSHIAHYPQANQFNHEVDRTRKLLLHGREIEKLWLKVQEKGFTIVPTKLYFKRGRIKLEIALAKGKDSVDKRQTIKKREADLEVRRALRRG